ncbi:MAG: pilus assembly protein CpaE [Actinomycetota bacterium]|nr:pilus assembly protein CpaE [Actinomycetota bacterium]
MEEGARVVLGMESGEVAEEVMHLFDRSGRARVVASADDDRRLAEAVRQLEPDVVVAQPSLCGALDAGRHVVVALDTRESVGSLRTALSVGARGYFVWPADRDALGAAVAAIRPVLDTNDARGQVIGIHAARGGAGATFLTCNLAGAFTSRGRSCVVIDADAIGADVGPSIGAPEEGVHTAAVLLRMGDELTTGHLVDALWPHPAGFRALLAPAPEAETQHAQGWLRVIQVASGLVDVVAVDLGANPPPDLFAAMDRVIEVLTPEVRTFRAAARFLDAVPSVRIDHVLNRAGRSELVPGDVSRAFGAPPIAVIPSDQSVARAQAAGRLLPERGRAGRAVRRLAGDLLAPGSGSASEEEHVQEL